MSEDMEINGNVSTTIRGDLHQEKPDAKIRDIKTVTAEIKTLHLQAQRMVLTYAIEIGRRLTEAKEILPHGEWGDWLAKEVNYSKSTANNFMRIFDAYGANQMWLFGDDSNRQALGNLSYTKALQLLAVPEEEREEFAETHDVESLSTRELDQIIKERDQARAEAECNSKMLDAEVEDGRKLRENLKNSKKELEQAKAEAEKKKAELDTKLSDALAEQRAQRDRIASLKDELKSLKNKPVEVAVQEPDKAQLDELVKAATAAANEKISEAEAKLAEAQKKAEAAANEADQLRRKLAESDGATATFKAIYAIWQADFQELIDALHAVDENDAEKGEKLRKAVRAAAEQMGAMTDD